MSAVVVRGCHLQQWERRRAKEAKAKACAEPNAAKALARAAAEEADTAAKGAVKVAL